MLQRLKSGDILICTELSRLGRSTLDVMTIIDSLQKKNIRLIFIKQGLNFVKMGIQETVMISVFSLLADLERTFISERTKAGLARAKAQGKKLGRKYTPRDYKLAPKADEVMTFFKKGISITAMGKLLNVSRHTVTSFLKRNKLKR